MRKTDGVEDLQVGVGLQGGAIGSVCSLVRLSFFLDANSTCSSNPQSRSQLQWTDLLGGNLLPDEASDRPQRWRYSGDHVPQILDTVQETRQEQADPTQLQLDAKVLSKSRLLLPTTSPLQSLQPRVPVPVVSAAESCQHHCLCGGICVDGKFFEQQISQLCELGTCRSPCSRRQDHIRTLPTH